MAHLYPLNEEKFMQLHRKAWENGWTYGPGFKELYDDYLTNWVYFVDYLDVLIRSKIDNSRERQYERLASGEAILCFEDETTSLKYVPDEYKAIFGEKTEGNTLIHSNVTLKFFIGEAPPYWKGPAMSNNELRSYLYNPNHQTSPWLDIPVEIFLKKVTKESDKKKIRESPKLHKLEFLAKNNFILLDIFPFPIDGNTAVRQKITNQFHSWLNEDYFTDHYKKCLKYIRGSSKITFENQYAIAMPLYSSLQFCFDEKSRLIITTKIDADFYTKPINELEKVVSENHWEIIEASSGIEQKYNIQIVKGQKKPRYKFILDINPSIKNDKSKIDKSLEMNKKFKKDYIVLIPILTTGKQNLSHDQFINSKQKNGGK